MNLTLSNSFLTIKRNTKKISQNVFSGILSASISLMENNSVHIMTAIMTDLIVSYVRDSVEELDIPRELVVYTIGTFLGDYEDDSLMLATQNLLNELTDHRKRFDQYNKLTADDIVRLDEKDKEAMRSDVQAGVLKTLMMDCVMELVAPLT